jgi:hypothetical protein
MMNDESDWDEAQLAAWLIEQITAYDNGALEPDKVAQLTEVMPHWNGEDSRFHLGLFQDWSEARMIDYLGSKIDAYDEGTMSSAEESQLDRTMPDWRSDYARGFCSRLPIGLAGEIAKIGCRATSVATRHAKTARRLRRAKSRR